MQTCMQVYVHRGGEQLGPYGIDQLRQYVEAGQLTPQDHAFYEGAPAWIPLAEVPGFAKKSQDAPTKSEPKSKKKVVWIGGGVVLAASLAGGAFLLFGGEGAESPPETWTETKAATVSHPDVFVLQPSDVASVYDGDTFKVDLKGVHPLFGDDVSVRVNGIDTPEIKGESDEVEALGRQAREFVEAMLKGATKIELRNLQRGKYFRIVADVYVDGASLAEALKKEELAKDYDGEGAKPTW